MKVITRNDHDNATQAELTPEEINTIMWALYHYDDRKAKQLRDDLCGVIAIIIRFDGRGKNGL
jgi:pyruvate/2-oxoacid:ferredoxin oxidoreductase beta subunit